MAIALQKRGALKLTRKKKLERAGARGSGGGRPRERRVAFRGGSRGGGGRARRNTTVAQRKKNIQKAQTKKKIPHNWEGVKERWGGGKLKKGVAS